MTGTELAPPAIARSGVVVALPVSSDRAAVFALCALASSSAVRFAQAERDVIAVFGFESERGETAVAVSHLGADATALRPGVARMLGSPVVDAVRVDSFTTHAAPAAAVRAEALLLRVSRDIARAYGGLVCDDVGAIYEPEELDELVASGRTRVQSGAFVTAVADRLVELAAPKLAAPSRDLPLFDVAQPPSDCAPDIALDVASLFVAMGPHVPLLTATRMALVAARTPTLPVIAFAPSLGVSDASALSAAAIALARSPQELTDTLAPFAASRPITELVYANPYGRDEFALFSDALEFEDVRALFERRALAVAEIAASGANDQPAIALLDDAAAVADAPMRLGRFAFANAILDFYYIDFRTAHPLLAMLLGARATLRAALGTGATAALVCETIVDGAYSTAADAFCVSVFAEAASGRRAVAQDDAGALFDSRALERLGAARRGRDTAWNERVAWAQA